MSSGPGTAAPVPGPDEDLPPIGALSRRTIVTVTLAIVLVGVLAALVLPELGAMRSTIDRIRDGDPAWLAIGAAFSVLSFGGYVVTFKGVYTRPGEPSAERIGFFESYEITMAALAATRVFAAGGAGGVALTAWALRRAGMPARVVADRTIAFLVLTYAVYLLAVIVGGLGLWANVLPGPAPVGVTLVPAIAAIVLFVVAWALTRLPGDLERRLAGWASGHGRLHRLAARAATVPATVSEGVRLAVGHVRRRDAAVAGAVAYWGFNIAILWACFHAFGSPPATAVLVVAYFVGLLGNLLPLPGGIGGVDGGMIGALVAFGSPGSLAVVAVLAFRVLAFWLPTFPGAVAYLQLRRTVARWRVEREIEDASGGVTIRSEVRSPTPTRSAS